MPPYHARLAGLVEEFGEANSKGLGADELAQVAEAARNEPRPTGFEADGHAGERSGGRVFRSFGHQQRRGLKDNTPATRRDPL
jgi:hypothetical protein